MMIILSTTDKHDVCFDTDHNYSREPSHELVFLLVGTRENPRMSSCSYSAYVGRRVARRLPECSCSCTSSSTSTRIGWAISATTKETTEST